MITKRILRTVIVAALAASCLVSVSEVSEAAKIRRAVKRRLRPGRGFFVNRDVGYRNHGFRYNAHGSHHDNRYGYETYYHGSNCASSGWHGGYSTGYRGHHNNWYGY